MKNPYESALKRQLNPELSKDLPLHEYSDGEMRNEFSLEDHIEENHNNVPSSKTFELVDTLDNLSEKIDIAGDYDYEVTEHHILELKAKLSHLEDRESLVYRDFTNELSRLEKIKKLFFKKDILEQKISKILKKIEKNRDQLENDAAIEKSTSFQNPFLN